MIRKTVKAECRALHASIDLFNKSKLTYYSANYFLIAKVTGDKIRQRNDKDKAEKYTPQVNNTKPTKTKSIFHKTMMFKDALVLPTHSLFRILSHGITCPRG